MQTEELKILLALEPSWTVSLNGHEFIPLQSKEIDVRDSLIRFGSYTRRILKVQWLRPNIVRVHGRAKFRSQQDVITFFPGNRLPPGVESTRKRRSFQKEIAEALAEYFQTRKVTRLGIAGGYPRFRIGSGVAIAVDPDESSSVINGIMRNALVWSTTVRKPIAVVIPALRSQTIATRLDSMPALRSRFEWLQWDGERIAPLSAGRAVPETHVHPYFEHLEPRHQAEVARICGIAPHLLQAVPNIAGRATSIRLRGLEVASVTENGVNFPMGEPLEPLIANLDLQRRHGSRHLLARAHEERWLESNLIGQIADLLPVHPQAIYPQVPSFVGEDRNVIDLLTVTNRGQLVVIEIKVSADPDLPFQALDYWLAVERHRKAGDFQAKGYFRNIDIRDEPTLLVLVAPLLAFHRTLNTLVSMLPKTLPLQQIGINQGWKRQIKILRRKGLLG